MATLEADLLFQLDMRITGGEQVGVGPRGTRVIAYVKGTFAGPGLKGTVENGADWYLLRPDGLGELDVRLELPGLAEPVTAKGKITWAEASGRAGFRFVNVEAASQHRLDQWLRARVREEGWGQTP